jgi:hypothetical protein
MAGRLMPDANKINASIHSRKCETPTHDTLFESFETLRELDSHTPIF